MGCGGTAPPFRLLHALRQFNLPDEDKKVAQYRKVRDCADAMFSLLRRTVYSLLKLCGVNCLNVSHVYPLQ